MWGMNDEPPFSKPRTWRQKFRDAAVGLRLGTRGQSSFLVHLPMAVVVVICGFAFQVSRLEWCLLVLAITVVLTAEMFNSALEAIAPAVDRRYNPHIAAALDIASAAVLLAACGASACGAIIFLYRLGALLHWWPGS